MAKLFRDLKDTKPEIQGASRVTQLAMGVVGGLAKANAAGGRFCVSAAAIIPELLPFLSTSKEVLCFFFFFFFFLSSFLRGEKIT